MVTTAGLGGESTGFGIETANGVTELDMATDGFALQFVENANVTIAGHFMTVGGIETPTREVLMVESMKRRSL